MLMQNKKKKLPHQLFHFQSNDFLAALLVFGFVRMNGWGEGDTENGGNGDVSG